MALRSTAPRAALRRPTAGARLAAPARLTRAVNRSSRLSVCAMVREWPDREFIAETLAAFPDAGVANVEQARVSGEARS